MKFDTLHWCPSCEGELWWSDPENEYSEKQDSRDLSNVPQEHEITEWVPSLGGRALLERPMAMGQGDALNELL